jgi:hypothetical protein
MKKCKELPWPPRFIYTGITFLMLDIFALFNEELAGVTSVGSLSSNSVHKNFLVLYQGGKPTASMVGLDNRTLLHILVMLNHRVPARYRNTNNNSNNKGQHKHRGRLLFDYA